MSELDFLYLLLAFMLVVQAYVAWSITRLHKATRATAAHTRRTRQEVAEAREQLADYEKANAVVMRQISEDMARQRKEHAAVAALARVAVQTTQQGRPTHGQ